MKYVIPGRFCNLTGSLAFCGVVASLLLLPSVLLAAGTGDFHEVIVSNVFRQMGPSDTSYFMGDLGVGTNTPGSKLHVAGGLTVDGAMVIPRQGDLGMGQYTNGASAEGASSASGALPPGATGNLLYFNGIDWIPMTNVYFEDGTAKFYFNSTNSGTCIDTVSGQLTLSGDPSGNSNAVTLGYLESQGYLKNVAEDATPQLGGSLDAQTHQINNLADPASSQDAVTQNYVTNTVKFLAEVSGSKPLTNNAYTTVRFNSEIVDTANGYNPTTGVFTVPVAGFYQFNANVISTTNVDDTRYQMWLLVNSISQSGASEKGGAGTQSHAHSCVGFFNASDTVAIVYWHNTGSTIYTATNRSFFGGFQVR